MIATVMAEELHCLIEELSNYILKNSLGNDRELDGILFHLESIAKEFDNTK